MSRWKEGISILSIVGRGCSSSSTTGSSGGASSGSSGAASSAPDSTRSRMRNDTETRSRRDKEMAPRVSALAGRRENLQFAVFIVQMSFDDEQRSVDGTDHNRLSPLAGPESKLLLQIERAGHLTGRGVHPQHPPVAQRQEETLPLQNRVANELCRL